MTQTKNTGWFSADAATFGDRLAGAREAMGLSQQELAGRLGVRARTLEAWENDRAEPRANRIQMLAGMLGVSLMWLMTGEGDGLDGPERRAAALPEGNDLAELREIRADLEAIARRLGKTEKRLRAKGLAQAEAESDLVVPA